MDKPITLIKEDYVKNLIDITNASGLPLFIVELVVKEFLETLHIASQQQLEKDRQAYIKELEQIKQEKK